MQRLTSFFKGNTKPIKDEVKKQIQKAILKQHFERAAKLRDIFTEIDALTEQQTVVVQEKIQGYVIHVKQVGQWWIYILLYFYEGKLIDIIRHKEHINDKEEDEIVFDLNREFGTLYPQSAPKNELIISTIKKLKKSSQKELQILTEQLFQSYLINSSFDESNLINELLKTLQTRYELKNFPYRIECIDISHLSGGRSSGGLACLLGGIKYPHGYRRYKMQTPGGDDYLALQELIIRRFEHMDAENNLPSCLVIDGGKGQLNIIKKLYQNEPNMRPILDKIDIISLGKGEARNKTKI
jgi:excinuclease ABC subunit C